MWAGRVHPPRAPAANWSGQSGTPRRARARTAPSPRSAPPRRPFTYRAETNSTPPQSRTTRRPTHPSGTSNQRLYRASGSPSCRSRWEGTSTSCQSPPRAAGAAPPCPVAAPRRRSARPPPVILRPCRRDRQCDQHGACRHQHRHCPARIPTPILIVDPGNRAHCAAPLPIAL
jgi:hypothetical protein